MSRRKEDKKKIAETKRQLKEERKAEKMARKQSNAEFRPKNQTGKRLLFVFLWLVIFFFAAKGLIMTYTAEDSESVKTVMNEHVEMLGMAKDVELEAGVFAKNFAYDYFTYTASNDGSWSNKMDKYVAENVILTEPKGTISQKVMSSEIKKINIINKTKADIDISVRVEFDIEQMVGAEKTIKTQSNVYIVRVPVEMKKGHFAVVSTPMFVSDTNNAKTISDIPVLDGDMADMDEISKVEKLAASFFGSYYGGKASDLKYYTTREFGSNATVHGTLAFKSVKRCEVVTTDGGYKAKAEVVLSDGAVELTQICFLDIVQGSEGRLYVNGLSTR